MDTAKTPVFLVPAAEGWNVVRRTGEEGAWDVRPAANLEEAIPFLNGTERSGPRACR